MSRNSGPLAVLAFVAELTACVQRLLKAFRKAQTRKRTRHSMSKRRRAKVGAKVGGGLNPSRHIAQIRIGTRLLKHAITTAVVIRDQQYAGNSVNRSSNQPVLSHDGLGALQSRRESAVEGALPN